MNDIQLNEGQSATADSSRRDFLKKAAIVAWSAPVIMTVTANRASAFHAGTCHTSGQACQSTVTTPRKGCCATNTAGAPQTCCTTGTTGQGTPAGRNNTCGSALLASCQNNNDCCSGNCLNPGGGAPKTCAAA